MLIGSTGWFLEVGVGMEIVIVGGGWLCRRPLFITLLISLNLFPTLFPLIISLFNSLFNSKFISLFISPYFFFQKMLVY